MFHRNFAFAGLALAVAAWPAVAAAPQAAATGWTVVQEGSSLGFEGMATGSRFAGEFQNWDAAINFDPEHLEQSMARVTIDMSSALTDDPGKDQSLLEADWFSAALFPQATFETIEISALGDGNYVAQGTLSIRDISAPVSLPFTLHIDGDTATMAGSLTLDRTTWGVGQGAWKSGSSVALEVIVNVEVTARRAS